GTHDDHGQPSQRADPDQARVPEALCGDQHGGVRVQAGRRSHRRDVEHVRSQQLHEPGRLPVRRHGQGPRERVREGSGRHEGGGGSLSEEGVKRMSGVRVLVGTRKGAFILTADGKREKWDVSGPHFAGWEIYHMKGSSVDPNRIYASQNSGWFGQIIQRSDDGGKTWFQPGTPAGAPTTSPEGMPMGESNKFVYDTSEETGKPLLTHQWYDGTPHPWEFKRVWHLEPSLDDADTVFAGIEDAALFRSTNGGQTWHELPGLRGHGTGSKWQPGAGGMCLHTFILDAGNRDRIYVAISA